MLIALNQKKKNERKRKKAFMDYEKHISFLKYPDKSSRELKVSRSILQYIRILLKRNVMIVLLHFFLFSLKYI